MPGKTGTIRQAGGTILPDDELVDTVCNLVEKPFAICGTFEERFLALPREVLITSMREHQKYFAVVDATGKLMPHCIAVNNTGTRDAKLAADGHQRVIRARLEDAFFTLRIFFHAEGIFFSVVDGIFFRRRRNFFPRR